MAAEKKHCDHCVGRDATTHNTDEHDEDYIVKLDGCGECGAGPGEECKPDCWVRGENERKGFHE